MKAGSSQSQTAMPAAQPQTMGAPVASPQPVAAPAPQVAPAIPQWQQQYQDLQASKGQGGPDLTQLMNMIQQPQRSTALQAYKDMRGGGFYGGIIPQTMSGGTPIFRQAEKPAVEQKNPTTFGQSPWPGVWGGV